MSYFRDIQSVEVVDKYTARFRLSAPYAPLLNMLAALQGSAIAPRRWGESKTDWKTEAVGSGPFRVAEYVPYSHLRLVKHGDYWESGLPYLDEITFKIMVEEDARVAGLRAGTVQHAIVTPDAAGRLAGTSGLDLLESPGEGPFAIFINTRRKPWDDPRVRQAASLAIDRKDVIQKASGGKGAISGPVVPALSEYAIPTEELERRWYTKDIQKARELLTAAGFPNGLKTTLYIPTDQLRSDVALAAQSHLREAGIDAEIVRAETAVWQSTIRRFEYDLTVNAWGPRADPDGYFSRSYKWKSDLNFTGYGSDALDAKIDKAKEAADPQARKDLYREIQEEVLDNAICLYMFAAVDTQAVHNSLRGYQAARLGRRKGFIKSWVAA
jgi:peptide/nickel transport system substrate-binding protein